MVVVFIETNIQSKMMNTDTMIICRHASEATSKILSLRQEHPNNTLCSPVCLREGLDTEAHYSLRESCFFFPQVCIERTLMMRLRMAAITDLTMQLWHKGCSTPFTFVT